MTREEILAMEPGHELNSLVIDEIGFNECESASLAVMANRT